MALKNKNVRNVAERSQLREKAAARERRANWLSGARGQARRSVSLLLQYNEEHGVIGGMQ